MCVKLTMQVSTAVPYSLLSDDMPSRCLGKLSVFSYVDDFKKTNALCTIFLNIKKCFTYGMSNQNKMNTPKIQTEQN